MPQQQFEDLRKQYPVFSYDDYTITRAGTRVRLTFHFSVKGLCRFAPTTEIETENLNLLNDPDSPLARRVVFALGMVELVSYWKAACPKRVEVHCGALSDEDIHFWKRLYFRGLSEFFYRNGIRATEDDFMELVSVCKHTPKAENIPAFRSAGLRLVPVGGGKDSCVTASLLHGDPEKNRFFTVNDQKARTDTVLAAGYTEKEMVRAYRTIDRTLLDLNAKGFLNGHTPFSAIVAFLSYYCAYLIGATDIVLSNEASANESNIAGTEVNHQYSKSYDFECDFAAYCARRLTDEIRYFSLLRPFTELQIAKQFAALPQYHETFRSCNRGSKQNVWCGKCAKCLFVFSILSPFMDYDRLCEIFGADLLDDRDLLADFEGLCGFAPVKPFECVGTASEIVAALWMTAEKLQNEGRKLPALLAHFCARAQRPDENPLQYWNPQHNIPAAFLPAVKEMYRFVAADC